MATEPSPIHIGLGLGRVRHWYDGLGEFSTQLGMALAAQAAQLRRDCGWRLHFHLPKCWHGRFGNEVGYLDTANLQRWIHWRGQRFALWHTVHQHNRLRAPLGTRHQVETVHDLNFLRSKSPAKIERYRRIQRHRLARCDAAVAITHFVADEMARELAPLPTPLRVIHNGATDLSRAAREPVAGLDPATPYLLHISRMAPSKNIVALLDLAAAWPEQKLVLAGATSDYTQAVQGMLVERRLSNVQVHLDLTIGQKAWLYANCRGFLFPSWSEGFGLPPIEAMHFGKPVFLSRLTSLPEVGGDVAYYFDAFDGRSMREVVEAGLASHSVPGAAQRTVGHAQGFSWERCAQDYITLYQQLLGATT